MSTDIVDDSWSISVKTVGIEQKPDESRVAERDFTVRVSPDDGLASLYDQIEGVTGLKASQQRLIYRGRLIGSTAENAPERSSGSLKADLSDDEQKIRDIVGLSDGQTIHLVRKRDQDLTEGETNENETSSSSSSQRAGAASAISENDTSGSMSGLGTASLLAALLGIGAGDDDDTANDETTAGRRWRPSRYGTRRRSQFRLTSDDLEVADPGSMEPVRQGLMTLHTMLPYARPGQNQDTHSPLDANRQWYRGQWIDCRDTVNQWLEATVVDIVQPDDILPPRTSESFRRRRQGPTIHPATDPAVSSGDLQGRRKLLLEPCEEGDSDDEGGELVGFRRRDNNDGVQLLLIHYNGWPHRWDEWIRSDSERIRPFRVRTRHPSVASHASPTPQSVFTEAPSTNIRHTAEVRDREALLPELTRMMSAVNGVLAEAATGVAASSTTSQGDADHDNLPWHKEGKKPDDDDLEDLPPLCSAESGSAPDSTTGSADEAKTQAQTETQPTLEYSRRDLEALAPLLDRLGRCLIDASPHVAALASSMPGNGQTEEIEAEDVPPLEPIEEHPNTLGGLLSLLSRDRRRQSISSTNVGVGDNASSAMASVENTITSHDTTSVDPDFTDFASGAVNTSRGEVRSGPRSRGGQGDDVAGLLGAYLAAASLGNIPNGESEGGDDNANNTGLGRIVRERGSGGGGIDIHIHAVVTAPGMGPGGVGLATLGGASPTASPAAAGTFLSQGRDRRSNSSHTRLRSPAVLQEDEDMGIFSELYSENPDPVNPNQSPSESQLSLDGISNDSGDDFHSTASRSSSTASSPGRRGVVRRDSIRRTNSRGGNRLFGRLFRRSGDAD